MFASEVFFQYTVCVAGSLLENSRSLSGMVFVFVEDLVVPPNQGGNDGSFSGSSKSHYDVFLRVDSVGVVCRRLVRTDNLIAAFQIL